MTNNEGIHAKSKSKVRRRYPALQLFRIEPEYGGCPETAARRGQPPAGTDRVGVVDQVSPPAKTSFLMTAWTPQFPSTIWVMPKSTPIDRKDKNR
jgi:hypothetical protein